MAQHDTNAGGAPEAGGGGLLARLLPGAPTAPGWLGLAGLLPFFACAAGVAMLDDRPSALASELLAGYGAVILSFMGGCRWGFAAVGLGAERQGGAEGAWSLYALAVLPALYAWPVAILPEPWRAGLLALGFLLLLWADLRLTAAGGAPSWWPALRLPLSLAAAGCLLVGATFA